MDEDDPEPEVDVEVRVFVILHEVRVIDAARRHHVTAADVRRDRHPDVVVLEEATDLRGRGRRVDDAGRDDHVRDGAPAVGERRVADAQVTLQTEAVATFTTMVELRGRYSGILHADGKRQLYLRCWNCQES